MVGELPGGPPQAPAPPAGPPPTAKQWASTEARVEPAEGVGTSRVPFEVVDRQAYLAAIKPYGSIAAKTHGAPIALVNLADIKAIQETINDERLAQHLENPAGLVAPGAKGSGHGGLVDRPVVVRLGGVLYAHDGHHRLTAAHLRGQTTAKVRLVDLDGEFPPKGR